MNFPISIGRMSLFQNLGMFGGIFLLFSNSNRTFCEQAVETLSAASDMRLRFLPKSNKKDARLIWVNRCYA